MTFSADPPETVRAQPDPSLPDLQAALALIDEFDPLAAPFSTHTDGLSVICEEVISPSRYRWTLSADRRSTQLGALQSSAELQRVIQLAQRLTRSLDRNAGARDPQPLLQIVQGLSAGKNPASLLRQADRSERFDWALSQAKLIPALFGTGDVAVDQPGIAATRGLKSAVRTWGQKRAADKARSYRTAAITRFLPRRLYGRRAEVKRVVAHLLGGESTKPLGIVGSAGMGKSSVLAKVIHDLDRRKPRPFLVYLDFDQPSLAQGDLAEVTAELFKQLAQNLRVAGTAPELATQLDEERNALRQRVPESSYSKSIESQRSGWASSIWRALEGWDVRVGDAPVALVVDSCEVLNVAGPGVGWLYQDWFPRVREVLSRARLVMAGRSLVDRKASRELADAEFLDVMELKPLEAAPARRLFCLQRQKNTPEIRRATKEAKRLLSQAAAIAAALTGGHPLYITLLARQDKELDDGAMLRRLQDLKPEDFRRGGAFAHEYLYVRILDRLPPELRAIAQPGLLLPEINAELIQHVLRAPETAQTVDDPEGLVKAEELLKRLEQSTWFLVPSDGGRPGKDFRHRPDLRVDILPAMLEEAGRGGQLLLRRAADFIEQQLKDKTTEYGQHLAQNSHRGFYLAQIMRLLAGDRPDYSQLLERAVGLLETWPAEVDLLPTGMRAAVIGLTQDSGRLTAADIASIPDDYAVTRRELQAGRGHRSKDPRLYTARRVSLSLIDEVIEDIDPVPGDGMSWIELEGNLRIAFVGGNDDHAASLWHALVNRLFDPKAQGQISDSLRRSARERPDFWLRPFWLGALAVAQAGDKKALRNLGNRARKALLGGTNGDLGEALQREPLTFIRMALLFGGKIDPALEQHMAVLAGYINRELGRAPLDSRTVALALKHSIEIMEGSRQLMGTSLAALGQETDRNRIYDLFQYRPPDRQSRLSSVTPADIDDIHSTAIPIPPVVLRMARDGRALWDLRPLAGTSPEVRLTLEGVLSRADIAVRPKLAQLCRERGRVEGIAPGMTAIELLLLADRLNLLSEALDVIEQASGVSVERARKLKMALDSLLHRQSALQ